MSVTSRRTAGVAVAVALVAVALLSVLALALRPAAPDDGQRLTQAADRFAPPAGWELVEASSRGPGQVCVDVECPSATRRYATAGPVSAGEVQALMEQAGWTQVGVEGDCQPQAGRTGSFPLCRAEAAAGSDQVRLVVAGPGAGPGGGYAVTVTLSR